MKPENNMENFSELIKNRRSMRKFTDEELTQDEVVALMKAALMSPSSKRSNSWQFVVVDDKENFLPLQRTGFFFHCRRCFGDCRDGRSIGERCLD
mgnify:CR=1 FL=1